MQNGIVRFKLASELATRASRMTFDAMLGGAEWEQHRDGPRAAQVAAIARLHGVAMASQAFIASPGRRRSVMMTRNIAAEMQKNPGFARTVAESKRMDHGTGEFRILQNPYTAYTTPYVWFLVRGDLKAIERTLLRVHFIGALRHKGFGEVDAFDVQPVASNNPAFGVVGDGMMLRPVPVRLKRHFAATRHVLKTETWNNPYHLTANGEECMVPPTTDFEPVDVAGLRKLAA